MINKKYFIFIPGLLLALAGEVIGQVPANKPSSASQPSAATATINPVPSAYSNSIKLNYVRARQAIGPINTINSFDTASYLFVQEATNYFDGLGRTLQTVTRQASPLLNDLVSPVVYDAFGREQFKYLPYVPTTGDGRNDGSFKLDPFNDQSSFYGNTTLNPGLTGEQVYYSRTAFEASPLSRPDTVFSPGNSWAGSNRGIRQLNKINKTADSVRIWTIGNSPLLYLDDDTVNVPVSNAFYNAGELYKTIVIDEQGYATVEYKDREGLVILKKIQVGNIPSDFSGHEGFLNTYYVYDDFNQLRFVIPPNAVEEIKSDWSLLSFGVVGTVVRNLCFHYAYDARNRMIGKKVPGAGWVYMIYDKRDRLVYTQDANMRLRDEWHTTLYDALNRPVMTGLTTFHYDRDSLQNYVNGLTSPEQLSELQIENPNPNDVYVDHREEGLEQYEARSSISFKTGFTSESTSEFETILDDGPTGIFSEISVENNPIPDEDNFIALTITYYDNYDWTDKSYSTTHNTKLSAGDNLHAETLPSQADVFTTGMVTGTKVRLMANLPLEDQVFVSTVSFYDSKGRVIQTQSENYKGGEEILTSQYDFAGKILSTYQVHHNPAASQRLGIATHTEYDHSARIVRVLKSIYAHPDDDVAITTQKIAENKYDELGRLVKKELGRNTSGTPIETLDYSYNIRGWLQGINPEFANGTSSANWFGMTLNYDWGFDSIQLNGNIAGTKWRSRGDGERRSYGFGYDKLNRLLYGDFKQYNGSSYIDNGTINFDIMMGNGRDAASAYDANGNILAMKQWGLKVNNSSLIDNLVYYYYGSNQLYSIIDSASDMQSKLGDFVNNRTQVMGLLDGEHYRYDKNGNLTLDRNKGLCEVGHEGSWEGIYYNHLNLPTQIRVYTKGSINYTYDALGNKLEKVVIEERDGGYDTSTVTTYINGLVYENDVLQFLGHEEGRVRYAKKHFLNGDSANLFLFDYFLKDHLGNVRMVLTEQKDTTHYVATMEAAYRAKEERLFFNIAESESFAASVPGGYPTETSVTNPNLMLSKLNGSGQKLGPAIVLKVMSGDTLDICVKSYYLPQGSPGGHVSPLVDILSALSSGIVGAIGEAKGTQATLSDPLNSPLLGAISSFRNTNNPDPSGKPKAYLNWILFNEQFNHVNSYPQSGAIPVGNASVINTLAEQGITITKNGYLYIYVSNETENWDVFFDNLSVRHYAGALMEETHYYPFGLAMAGISSKALKPNYAENKYKYNGGNELQSKEFSDGSGLEMYDATFRTYDPQIGRFHQIDPLADMFEGYSSYVFAFNNPVLLNDPLGLAADTTVNPAPVSPTPSCEDCPTGRMAETKELPAVIVSAKKTEKSYKWYEFFNDHNPGGDFLYELNKWNPLAIGVNAGKGYLTGTDTYGVKKSGAEATTDVVGLAAGPILRIGNVVISAGTSAFKHSYKYASRIRVRAVQDPVAHNFPYSFDDIILAAKPIVQKDGSKLYKVAGSLNGKDGFFEIAVNEITGEIFHRTFVKK